MKTKTKFPRTNASNRCIQHKSPYLIKNVMEKKLLSLKLHGNENFPALKKKYFRKLKNLLTKKHKEGEKTQLLDIVFTHLKRSSTITCILPELTSFITSELKTIVNLKPTIILKALYCLFLNENISVKSNVSFNIVCTSSLKNFLAKSLKCSVLGYLLKDIAADILCELSCIFLSGTSMKLPSCNFHCLDKAQEDSYGATVAWLSSMTSEDAAKLVRWEALCSETFLRTALNFPKMFARLVTVCESHVYCCLPTQIPYVSVNETQSLYKLVVYQIFYNLMRHEAVYSPVFYLTYEPRTSKPVKFSDLLFEVNLTELLESSPCGKRERDMPDDCRPPPKKKLKRSPKDFYTSETCSYMEKESIRCKIDIHLVSLGNQPDIYNWEKASICHLSTSSSDRNPFNLKLHPF